ncbi:peptidylprolyl isomerase [Phaeovibrio sulfidiphilus]|uniref:Parvulin-like PPIase n=1 Tax=Phaeovibrio sulfidiphilus TaxID=1220600 RepID=A0A8J6YLQ1_9PROT|nr:peptidylprolyl isomerase [Phaeovibrio sulfidiphilus]MBE1236084.1 peptidylprolyl isomerase [Phaeovibrio sulfidiphilus]
MSLSRFRRLALAGAALLPLSLAAGGALAQAPADPVVARINGTDLHLSVIQARFDNLKASQPQMAALPLSVVYEQILEGVVDAKLLTEAGRKAGLDKDPEVQKDLATLLDQLVGNAWVAKVLHDRITDQDIQKRYDELKASFKPEKEVHARHILVDTEEAAKKLIERLKKGEDFAKLANENTQDPGGRQNGGDLGFFSAERMVPEFSQAAFAMKKGEVSPKPVKSSFGWHVIKVEEFRDSQFPPLDAVREQIRAMLAQQVIDQELTRLKKEAKVEMFDMDGKPLKADEDAAAAPAPAAAPAETGKKK